MRRKSQREGEFILIIVHTGNQTDVTCVLFTFTAAWRKANYQDQPEHEAFRALLAQPVSDAAAAMVARDRQTNIVHLHSHVHMHSRQIVFIDALHLVGQWLAVFAAGALDHASSTRYAISSVRNAINGN